MWLKQGDIALETWDLKLTDKCSKNNIEWWQNITVGLKASENSEMPQCWRLELQVSWRVESKSGRAGFVSISASGWDHGKSKWQAWCPYEEGSNSSLKLECRKDTSSAKGHDKRKLNNLLNNRKFLYPPHKFCSWLIFMQNNDFFSKIFIDSLRMLYNVLMLFTPHFSPNFTSFPLLEFVSFF